MLHCLFTLLYLKTGLFARQHYIKKKNNTPSNQQSVRLKCHCATISFRFTCSVFPQLTSRDKEIRSALYFSLDFYGDKAPIPTKYLREILYLILKENSFQFCGSNYLQTHGTAMGTKMAVAFANIFIARIERQILSESCIKQLFWKRHIDDVFSLWNTSLEKIESFVKKANNFYST